jgi:hypothetical protein
MNTTMVKSESPKPNLRIRIPPPRTDEEILRSPIETPTTPDPVVALQAGLALRKWFLEKLLNSSK